MMAGYTAGELIHHYTTIGTSYFTSTDGLGTTLASQMVNGQTYNAVLATMTGGHNVHFATEGMMADNNMLAHALDWTTQPAGGPQLSLHMSRDKAIVAARIDMDQAMETPTSIRPRAGHLRRPAADPGPVEGGVQLRRLLLHRHRQQRGTGPDDDWAYSKPYFDQMLAMGNEIGSHSYTHPENTNLLTAAQFQFEFQQARQVIEQQLGLTNIGVAVPGAPETIDTARQIAQYYPCYISGGASLVGAGYPGAIGYLTPGDMNSVYIAPNTSFDFTLVGFQKLTVEQAEAAWAKEWASLTAHSDLPVIVWPWHDYGPTNWLLDPGVASHLHHPDVHELHRAGGAGRFRVRDAGRLGAARRELREIDPVLQLRRGGECRFGDRRHHRQRPRHLCAGPGNGQHDQERDELVRLRQRQRLRGQVRRQLHDRARRHPGRRHRTSSICRTGRNCSA